MLNDVDPTFLFALGTAVALPAYIGVYTAALNHPRIRVIKPHSAKIFCASCAKDLLNALISGPIGLYLLPIMLENEHAHTRCEVLKPNLLVDLPVPPLAMLACGVCVGFFLSDCVILFLAPDDMARELGGRSAYALMWVHHLLAILIWPYALIASRSAVFAVYFLATECTNVGQNLYVLTSKGQLFGRSASRIEAAIGGLWILSFFALRVAVLPYLGNAYLNSHFLVPTDAPKIELVSRENAYGCGLGPIEWGVSVVSIALPVAMNQFWFCKMLAKVWRMATGTSRAARLKDASTKSIHTTPPPAKGGASRAKRAPAAAKRTTSPSPAAKRAVSPAAKRAAAKRAASPAKRANASNKKSN